MTRVECATCGWFNESRDQTWTRHAGKVHVEVLKPGHALKVAGRFDFTDGDQA